MKNLIFILAITLGLSACATVEQERATTRGGLIGAAAGAAIGSTHGRTVEGALIGGALGAAAGAVLEDNSTRTNRRQPQRPIHARTINHHHDDEHSDEEDDEEDHGND